MHIDYVIEFVLTWCIIKKTGNVYKDMEKYIPRFLVNDYCQIFLTKIREDLKK